MPAKRRRGPKRTSRLSRARRRGPRAAPTVEIPLAYNVRVSDVMSVRPILIGTDASLFDAVMLMRCHDITGVPVTDASRRVVGVLSQRDIARVLSGSSGFPAIKGLLDILMVELADQPTVTLWTLREKLERTPVRDVMSSPPLVVAPEAPLEVAAEAMRDNEVNRLPVVRDGGLVGIVTRDDLVRAVVRATRPSAKGQPSSGVSARRPVAHRSKESSP